MVPLTHSELLKGIVFCVFIAISIIVLDWKEEAAKQRPVAADAQAFGAIPNDGKDDTAAIQAAVDSGAQQVDLLTDAYRVGIYVDAVNLYGNRFYGDVRIHFGDCKNPVLVEIRGHGSQKMLRSLLTRDVWSFDAGLGHYDFSFDCVGSGSASTFSADVADKVISALTPYDGPATRAKRAAATQDTWAAEVGTSSMAPAFPHRKGIEWTINRDLIRRRFNLWLLPNVHEGPHECDGEWMAGVPPRLWQDAGFRMAQGVDTNDRFPVRIQRLRAGVLTTITTVWVPAGPTPRGIQISFKSADWQEGDVLRIPLDSELLLVSCDPHTSHVIEPRLSGVEVASGDSTPLPGKMVRW